MSIITTVYLTGRLGLMGFRDWDLGFGYRGLGLALKGRICFVKKF